MDDALFVKNTNLEKQKIILKYFNQYISNTIKKLEDEEEVSIIEIKELIKLIVNFNKKAKIKLDGCKDSDSDSDNESTSSLMKLESTEDDSIKGRQSNKESDDEGSDNEKEEEEEEENNVEEVKKKGEDPLYLSFINGKPYLKMLANPTYDIFKNVEKFIKNSFIY